MTNRKCKIFSIFLALTLVFASVGVAFADDNFVETDIPNRYIDPSYTVSGGSIFGFTGNTLHDIGFVDRTLNQPYAYDSPFTLLYNFPSQISAGTHSVRMSVTIYSDNYQNMYFGNASYPFSVAEPVYGCHYSNGSLIFDAEEAHFTIEGEFANGSNNRMYTGMAYFKKGTYNLTYVIDNLYIDDVAIIKTVEPETSPIETYSFTIPYGSDLKISGQEIQSVLVRASTTRRGTLGNYLQKFNLSDIRYSAASDFEKSIPVPLKGTGKTSLTGGYSDFSGYCVPSNSFTIYNRVGNSNNISVDVYVNVTGRNVKGVYYSPQSNQDILDGVSSPTSENGDFAVTGGSGTPEDPYVTKPLNDDGVPIPYDALSPVIDNSPSDGVQNELLNRLDSIFAIPSRVASSVSGWIAGLAQLTTSLYSAFPPVITDLFVAFFSIVVLIGLVKMFL